MIGLATLHHEDGVKTAWIDEGGFQVQIAGELLDVEASLKSFYNPLGDIIRG